MLFAFAGHELSREYAKSPDAQRETTPWQPSRLETEEPGHLKERGFQARSQARMRKTINETGAPLLSQKEISVGRPGHRRKNR